MKKKMAILMTVIIMLSITASALPLLVGANDTQDPYLVRTLIDEEGRQVDVVIAGQPSEDNTQDPYLVKTLIDEEGQQVDVVIVPGRPPEIKAPVVAVPEPDIAKGINVLSNVPAFDWSYGCSATSAAMLFGQYDNTGYPNMYAGPTNGGVCPMTNSVWGSGECPLSATHQGYDGLATKGHVDDYWYAYDSIVDPYYGNWPEHGYADCTADYMGTNQYYNWQNTDGSTTFIYYTSGAPTYDYTLCEGWIPPLRDGCHGVRLFVESRSYNVYHDGTNYQNYNQYIHEYKPLGFTFDQFQAEIDAGRPVLIHVTGHTMLGYGYNTAGNIVYIHDTWDHSDHQMTWGGTYSGNLHKGVTVIHLTGGIPPNKPDLAITEKWVCWPDNCTICYNVTNIGDGTAPACHNTTLYVDGVEVAHDHVPVDLAHGESYIGCFDGYDWGYTPPSDNITICADNNETLDELDENNNCLTNIWMCGDVNCDGGVTMSDVRKVFNRYLDPNYPLDQPWAADVNCDSKVTMSDVRKVFNRYLDPGYGLNCCCEA